MRVRSVTAVGRMAVADRAAHDDLRIIGDEHPGFPEHFFELLIGLPVFEVLSQLPHFFEVDAVLAAGEHLHGSSHKGASYVLWTRRSASGGITPPYASEPLARL